MPKVRKWRCEGMRTSGLGCGDIVIVIIINESINQFIYSVQEQPFGLGAGTPKGKIKKLKH